jgi:CO/xanthine dehydrogenase FAD-binding subunit
VISQAFEFYAPTDVGEAVALLGERGPGAKVIAGGMSALPAMNLGLLRPETVISLTRTDGLDYVREDDGFLRIGAMTRHATIASHPLIAQQCEVLAEAARVIGDVQVRNRGTIGGSVAHADPAADYLPVLVALGAQLRLRSDKGERTVPAGEFICGVMMTEIEPSELLVELEVPTTRAPAAYVRFARLEGSFAIVNAAAVLGEAPVVVVGGATEAPVPVPLATDGSHGVSDDVLEAVGDAAYAACEDAFGDLSGDAGYRRALARVLARRAVAAAGARKGDST